MAEAAAAGETSLPEMLSLRHIDLDDVKVDKELARDLDIEALAASIAKYGQQVPAIVREQVNGKYPVEDGIRRVAALKLLAAGGDKRPLVALVRSKDSATGGGLTSLEALLTNVERADFTTADKAKYAAEGGGRVPACACHRARGPQCVPARGGSRWALNLRRRHRHRGAKGAFRG